MIIHGLVVSLYSYHPGSCVEYAATLFATELINVVWFLHHCLLCFVADIVPYLSLDLCSAALYIFSSWYYYLSLLVRNFLAYILLFDNNNILLYFYVYFFLSTLFFHGFFGSIADL